MADNQGGKLKLNLDSKEFKPKFMQNKNQQNQQNIPNQYMGYDMSSLYGYYPNQFPMQGSSYGMQPYGGYTYGPNNPGINPNQFQNTNFPKTQQTPQPEQNQPKSHDND